MIEQSKRRTRRQAVSPDEKSALLAFNSLLKSLSVSKGEDLGIRCEIDLAVRYTHMLQAIKEYKGPFDVTTANKIHSSMLKPIGPLKKMGGQVSLTRRSLDLSAQILGHAIQRSSGPRMNAQSVEKLIRRFGGTLTELANGTADGSSWTQVMLFFQNANSFARQPLETLVSADNLGPVFAVLKSGLKAGLAGLLQSGDVGAARQLVLTCARHKELEDALRNVLQQALSENASTLPRESQLFAMQFLGIPSRPARIEYANPAESPDTRQAAALLLYLFDMHRRSPELQEAFDRYRSIAGQQFSLYLRGIVNTNTLFDPRLHEPPESSVAGCVRIIRPWVEWYKPPDACVVIRGIVEPESAEGTK